MTIDLPGGYTVAIESTSRSGPPGSTGMQGNRGATWVRLARAGWDSGWHEAIQGTTKTAVWWHLVESEADVKEAWLGSVGGVWPPPRYDEVWAAGVAWLESL